MNLNDAQKKTVAAWIEQGLKLSDIQKRLDSEFGLSMTYMEVRFLIDDLKLQLKEPPAPPPPTAPPPAAALAAPAAATAPLSAPTAPGEDARPGTGKVSLSVDQVTRPGALVSGRVAFSDGESAEWYLDQQGRLGFAPKKAGYRPAEADVVAFQLELQSALARLGF